MRSTRAVVLPLVLLMMALGSVAVYDGGKDSYRLYVPIGYNEQVNRLIQEKKLRYECRDEDISTHGLNEDEQYFLENSYLKDDIEAWNRGDERAFFREGSTGPQCRGSLTSVDVSFHNQRLPFYEPKVWLGRLYLHAGVESVRLARDRRKIELSKPRWSQVPLPTDAFEEVWFGGPMKSARSQRFALKAQEKARYFATLQYVGDRVVVETTQGMDVSLNGCEIGDGKRVRLDPGDEIRLQDDQPEIDESYLFESGIEPGLVSVMSTTNGQPRRKTHQERLDFSSDAVRAIETAVVEARRVKADSRDDFDVHLTIDPFYNDLLNQELDRFCGAYREPATGSDEEGRRRGLRAAVTLLDGTTGRILALASYPSPVRAQQSRMLVRRSADRQRLATNHNFFAHPLGSAVKPFLAAAALAAHPELESLRIHCYPRVDGAATVLGYDLGEVTIPGHVQCPPGSFGFEIGLEEFLQMSSNRYMLALGLLALSTWNADGSLVLESRALSRQDEFSLGGKPIDLRPHLEVVQSERTAGATALGDVAPSAFAAKFVEIFDLDKVFQSGPLGDRLDMTLWAPVFAALEPAERSESSLAAFARVAPEKANLHLNLMQHLRQDFYTTMLGLGNNRWSNIHAAEALARLITGRRVWAHLVERVDIPAADDKREGIFDLPSKLGGDRLDLLSGLSPSARAALLRGMQSVFEPGGTAGSLDPIVEGMNRALAARSGTNKKSPVQYRLLGKTGTPTHDKSDLKRGVTVYDEAAVIGLNKDQVESAVLEFGIQRLGGDGESLPVVVIYIEGQGGSEQAVSFAKEVLQPLVEAYWPEDWLESANGG